MGAAAAFLVFLFPLAARPASSQTTSRDPGPAFTVNVNTAGEEQLRTLPGIGREEARRIIAGRPYASLEEFFGKAGIPPHDRAMLTSRIRLADAPQAPRKSGAPGPGRSGPAPAPQPKLPLDVNTSTIAELSSIHGLAPYASRIVVFRPYRNLGELSRAGVPRAIILECSRSLRVGPAAGS